MIVVVAVISSGPIFSYLSTKREKQYRTQIEEFFAVQKNRLECEKYFPTIGVDIRHYRKKRQYTDYDGSMFGWADLGANGYLSGSTLIITVYFDEEDRVIEYECRQMSVGL